MIYVLGWVVNYFLFFSSRYIGRRHAVAASILFVGAIAVLRGRVGTDTGFVYEPMASDISRLHNVEPLFGAWLSVLVAAFKDPLVAVTVGITSTFLLLLFIYLWRADSRTCRVASLLHTGYLLRAQHEYSEIRTGVCSSTAVYSISQIERTQASDTIGDSCYFATLFLPCVSGNMADYEIRSRPDA